MPGSESVLRPARVVPTRVRIVDPAFFNWAALPVALTDTIVPDFPPANRSFNLSYAGNGPVTDGTTALPW